MEVVGTRKNGRARRRHARVKVSPSRAPVLSFAHYFQVPARQATGCLAYFGLTKAPTLLKKFQVGNEVYAFVYTFYAR